MTKIWTNVGTFVLLSLIGLSAQAELIRKPIRPEQANSSALTYRGSHQVYWDTELNNHLLLITIAGTNSIPSDFQAFSETATSVGYSVIGVDYDNHIISTTCKAHEDDLCFDYFRREVVLGEAQSPLLKISRANSIKQRIHDILKLLVQEHPSRFAGFIVDNQIQWERIVVAGHSQGSGHAAYLSKFVPLRGVLLFAGPQDRFEKETRSVQWLRTPSRTAPERYFAFLHVHDFFGSAGQIKAASQLMEGSFHIEDQFIITDTPVRDPHMSVIFPQFTPQWRELLSKIK